MVFSSLVFLSIFFPLTFILHELLPSIRAKNVVLVLASLLFYAYGEPLYILLMLASTLVNWLFGLKVKNNKPALICAVVFNLALLTVFKYASMFVGSINSIASLSLPVPAIVLPLGISFYTFQALSYVIDVYREEVEAQKNYFKILLYISFFPQLVAGPIVKYHDIAEEIDSRSSDAESIAGGLRRFCLGLAKKVLLANVLASTADTLFGLSPEYVSLPIAWFAALSYLLQIYLDFSAYSDMAIGLGRMFGFHFQENFNYPYRATSIKEFWRRWHISLSTWFKEYLYIPLGGNRKGELRAGINKAIVFFLCGLWHGASWTFVIWGLIHGAFSLLEEFIPIKKLPPALGHLYTLFVVTLAFVIFRCNTLSDALVFLRALFVPTTAAASSQAAQLLLISELTPQFIFSFVAGAVLASGLTKRIAERYEESRVAKTLSYAASLCLLVLSLITLSSGTYNPFIYFRF